MAAVAVQRRAGAKRRPPARARRATRAEVRPPVIRPSEPATPAAAKDRTPFLLDFYPLQDAGSTRLSPFYDALRAGGWKTTRCSKDDLLLWPPRIVCPKCHSTKLEWVDLPKVGRLYAFSAVLAGAPLGMEGDLPFVVGLVDLEGAPLRIFTRIVGATWADCRIGQSVELEPYDLADGRIFYRFRAQ
jgi:uncharacterized protein